MTNVPILTLFIRLARILALENAGFCDLFWMDWNFTDIIEGEAVVGQTGEAWGQVEREGHVWDWRGSGPPRSSLIPKRHSEVPFPAVFAPRAAPRTLALPIKYLFRSKEQFKSVP